MRSKNFTFLKDLRGEFLKFYQQGMVREDTNHGESFSKRLRWYIYIFIISAHWFLSHEPEFLEF